MIVRHIRQWIEAGEQTLMVQLAGAPEKIDARHLEMAAKAGDPMALRALDQMALYLGVWVFNLYMTLNINCFVFGGGLINMGTCCSAGCGRCSTPTAAQGSRWSFSSPSAARTRASWAPWSCCSKGPRRRHPGLLRSARPEKFFVVRPADVLAFFSKSFDLLTGAAGEKGSGAKTARAPKGR